VILCDVNVLVYAHKEGVPQHDDYRGWLEDVLNGDQPFGVCDLVLSGFLRIVTHPKIFDSPSTWPEARSFVEVLRDADGSVPVAPGARHWSIFLELAEAVGAQGNALPDAYFAALAIESGAEWISADRGFARYPRLRWRHPLDQAS
jgi:uncharacterized protein